MRLQYSTLALYGVALAAVASGCKKNEPTDSEGLSGKNGINCVDTTTLRNDRLGGIKIVDHGIGLEEKKRHLNELNMMPEYFLRVTMKKITVEMSNGGLTDFPSMKHMKGVTPRGWPAGSTWDDVAGASRGTTTFLADSRKQNDAKSLAIHETTHSFDSALGLTNRDPRIIALFNANKTRANPGESASNHIYRQSYIKEFFAMAVDDYHCNAQTRATLKKNYPDAHDYVEKELSAVTTKLEGLGLALQDETFNSQVTPPDATMPVGPEFLASSDVLIHGGAADLPQPTAPASKAPATETPAPGTDGVIQPESSSVKP